MGIRVDLLQLVCPASKWPRPPLPNSAIKCNSLTSSLTINNSIYRGPTNIDELHQVSTVEAPFSGKSVTEILSPKTINKSKLVPPNQGFQLYRHIGVR